MRREEVFAVCLPYTRCLRRARLLAAQSPGFQLRLRPAPPAKPADSAPQPNRASAYYHAALADMYEEQAVNSGRAEYVQPAIEEYKAAINADPGSAALYDGLADLYFRTGRTA